MRRGDGGAATRRVEAWFGDLIWARAIAVRAPTPQHTRARLRVSSCTHSGGASSNLGQRAGLSVYSASAPPPRLYPAAVCARTSLTRVKHRVIENCTWSARQSPSITLK